MNDGRLEKALDDIKEWLIDNGARAVVANLAGPASEVAIASAERKYGGRFPEPLRALYSLHDGQKHPDEYPFVESFRFCSLELGRLLREGMLVAYFGFTFEDAEKASGDSVFDHARLRIDPGTPFQPVERSLRWWPVLETHGGFVAVSLDTGRVFSFVRDSPPFVFEAADLPSYFEKYADALWNDEFVLAGDPSLDDVQAEGFITMKMHAQHV